MSMLRASIGRGTSGVANASAALEIIAGARGCFIKELLVSLSAATASTYALGRPAALGTTPTSPVTSLLEGPGDGQSTVKTALAWAVGPTTPTAFFRRVTFPAVIGSAQLWTFVNGLYIPPNASIVLWNLALNGTVDVQVVTDE